MTKLPQKKFTFGPKSTQPVVNPEKNKSLYQLEQLREAKVPDEVGFITDDRILDNLKFNVLMKDIEFIKTRVTMMTIQFSQYQLKEKMYLTAWQRYSQKKYIYPDKTRPPRRDKSEHLGLNLGERELLREGFKRCVVNSNIVYKACLLGLEGYKYEVKLWFGTDEPWMIKKIIAGITKMNTELSDSTQIINFIDMRHQKSKNIIPSSVLTPAPGLATCYGQTASHFVSEINGHEPCVPQHLGSGIRLLIGEHIMQPYKTTDERALIMYHELTHQFIYTTDTGHVSLPDTMYIFGEESCRKIAKKCPEEAIQIAENWANFVAHVARSASNPLEDTDWELI